MTRRLLPALAGSLLLAGTADAAVSVVATTSSMGMLARMVGGDRVTVTVLAPPDRDAHYLQAKPSMILAARRADLLVSVGADLEVAWLPAVIQSAGNTKIQPGQQGYFEAAAQVPLIETGEAADRARGDVHPVGNPHLYMDPQKMADVASALGKRLAAIDPAGASQYKAAAESFASGIGSRAAGWKKRASGAPGVVPYHKDVNYLMTFLAVPVLGYIEPTPGVPPTAQQLRDLVQRLKGQKGVVVYTVAQPADGANFIAGALGWKAIQLPLEVAMQATADEYFSLIDRWVAAIAGAQS